MTTDTNKIEILDKEPVGYTMKEAIEEAKRCLHCKIPQCAKGCPIGNNIPEFIHQVSLGNFGEAINVIREKSNLPAICSRVCPHERQCQGHCILGKKGHAMNVGKLERFVADLDNEIHMFQQKAPAQNRGKVAIIGAGPAGLSAAGDLAMMGFQVTIYEAEKNGGGVMMYGIPDYRLPKTIVLNEIEKIKNLGVTFEFGAMIGEGGITVDGLFEQGYDAVFVGTGTMVHGTLDGTPGLESKGVEQGTHLLHQFNASKIGEVTEDEIPMRKGEKIGVVGGGNTAMDTARTALRLGGDVTVLYRRTQEEMPATFEEYSEAAGEGVKFMWKTTVAEFIPNEEGQLVKARLNTPDGEEVKEFDRIFMAVYSKPAHRVILTTHGVETDEKGYLITSEKPYGMTTRKGLFAAGDVVHRPQTVVMAMKAGKEVAKGIAEYIDAVKMVEASEHPVVNKPE